MIRLVIALLCFWATSAIAAQPEIIRGPVHPATATCGVYVNALPKVAIPAKTVLPISADPKINNPTGRVCDYSIATLRSGVHTVSMDAATLDDPQFGTRTSDRRTTVRFFRAGTAKGKRQFGYVTLECDQVSCKQVP